MAHEPSPCLAVLVAAALLLAGTAQAQLVTRSADPWSAQAPAAGIGLAPRATVGIGCGASLLPCADESAALAARRNPSSLRWAVEVAQPSFGPASRFSIGPSRQGLSLSLLGQRRIGESAFSVYGKLGTTYAASEGAGSALGADSAAGMSFGAGISWDVTPKFSATFGLDGYDLRTLGGPREQLRSTSLGLQYRY